MSRTGGIRDWMIHEYEKKTITSTINLRCVWSGLKVDKRDVKIGCPTCAKVFCPLIGNAFTIETEMVRKGRQRTNDKIVTVTYGTSCIGCKEKFRFKVIYDAFYYPKLGEY